ncbi:hypothetical protein [Chthonobacter albigriseus]|uniref:hypothetical protein n=1 Tax=Chthonobacter albigriseus TaxID=1683161 RepID=UPI0015EEFBE7|nr:hypothetical protein [Chthonobacter albigriseus]
MSIHLTAERLAAACFLALLAIIGLFAGLVGNLGVDEPFDKLVHAGFFASATAGLFFLFGRRAAAAALAAFAAGVLGEMAQGFIGSHTVSTADVLANAIGILLVVGLALPTTGVRRRRRELIRAFRADPTHPVWQSRR